MIMTDEVPIVSAIITPQDFWNVKNGCVYKAILAVFDAGMSIDFVTVTAKFVEYPEVADIGEHEIIDYLFMLNQSVPYTINLGDYARLIKEASLKRNIQQVALKILNGLYDSEQTVQGLLAKSMSELAQIDHALPGSRELVPAADYAAEILDEYETDAPQILTGLNAIDNLYRLTAGDYVLVGARPGMGKSGLVTRIAINIARSVQDDPKTGGVFFFTKEITGKQVVLRMACDIASLSLKAARDRTFTSEEQARYYDALGAVSKLPIRVMYGSLTPANIRRNVLKGIAKFGLPKLVIIDHIHLMGSDTGKENSQEQRITAISGEIKSMCLDFDLPFIVAAQLNRGTETRLDKEPELADLRGSGSLEQDADTVIFIHRPGYYDKDGTADQHEASLILPKNRWGEAPARSKAYWLGKAGTFRNLQYVSLEQMAKDTHAAKAAEKYEEPTPLIGF
jgi:replicative DNA helicase